MPTVGIRELKKNTGDVIRRVQETGEVINITVHGKVVAHIVPVTETQLINGDLDAIWANMDRLADEVTAQWKGADSAVEAVREVRREL